MKKTCKIPIPHDFPDTPCPICSPKTESWEEEFDKVLYNFAIEADSIGADYIRKEEVDIVKSFISSLIKDTEKRVVEEIVEKGNKLKLKNHIQATDNGCETEEEMFAYNSSLQDYQNLIKSKYERKNNKNRK